MLCDKVKRYEGVLFLPGIKRQAGKNYNMFWAQRFTTQISIIENNGIKNKRSYQCPLPPQCSCCGVGQVWASWLCFHLLEARGTFSLAYGDSRTFLSTAVF